MGCLLWPFAAIWRLVTGIVELTGRLIAVALGVVLVIGGAALCLTLIGAIIGVPLIAIGLLLIARGLF